MNAHRIRAIGLLALFTATVATCALVPTTASAAKPAAKPLTLRIATSSKTVTVPESDSVGGVFDYDQRITADCTATERSIAPGLTTAPRPLSGQSFGYNTVSAFATGQAGKVTFKLQALCAKGGTNSSVVTKRVPGTHVAGIDGSIGGLTTGRTTATASCGKGRVAIGTPLPLEFSPGLGRLVSKPHGDFGWRVVAYKVPDSLTTNGASMAYADVACVSTKHLKNRTVATKSTTGLHTATTATLPVACVGGRRPLGWGVDLNPYTRSWGASDGRWLLPTVSKAQLSASSINFEFSLPAGAKTGSENGLTPTDVMQTVYVVCGTLTGK